MVEQQPSKLNMRVRFPLPAPAFIPPPVKLAAPSRLRRFAADNQRLLMRFVLASKRRTSYVAFDHPVATSAGSQSP
jgi:hypothetical protein